MDISFIIPHKNSTSLLERLIKTIPNCFKSEIIVVDDYSSEPEQKRLQLLSTQYNFQLYENQGCYAGGARNTGIRHACGKWLLFADADDYYTENVESLIRKHINSDDDIIFFNVISKYSDTGENAYRAEHINSILKNAQNQHNNDVLRCCYTVPWGKMIKRRLIYENNILFDEVIAGNDMMFSVLSGLKAESVNLDNVPLYCVTVTYGSITTTLSKERFDSRFQTTLRVNNLLRKEGYSNYQISVLYFIAKSYQFGFRYMFCVLKSCIINRSNIFIGMNKLFKVKSVLRDRQNIQRK